MRKVKNLKIISRLGLIPALLVLRVLWVLWVLFIAASAAAPVLSLAHAYDPLEFVPKQVPSARLFGSATMRLYGRPEYATKLFADTNTFSADDLSRDAFALDFEYRRAQSATTIVTNITTELSDQGIANDAQIRDWHRQLGTFVPALRPHDHLTAVFWPHRGTGFFLNGKIVGEISGNDFCRAFFGIWLDPTSTMPDMRQKLLHGAG